MRRAVVRARLHPRDIVANRPDLPALEMRGGTIMAKFVLPHALGNAAAT